MAVIFFVSLTRKQLLDIIWNQRSSLSPLSPFLLREGKRRTCSPWLAVEPVVPPQSEERRGE